MNSGCLLSPPVSAEHVPADSGLTLYPNPNYYGILKLGKVSDIDIYTISGKRIRSFRDAFSADISALSEGIYFMKDSEGNVEKLINNINHPYPLKAAGFPHRGRFFHTPDQPQVPRT